MLTVQLLDRRVRLPVKVYQVSEMLRALQKRLKAGPEMGPAEMPRMTTVWQKKENRRSAVILLPTLLCRYQKKV